jgi:hypothetical protein
MRSTFSLLRGVVVTYLVVPLIGFAQSQAPSAPERTPFATQHRPPPGNTSVHDVVLKVWEEHVTWMRHYMISAVANLPDKQFVAERLMRNQEDIGRTLHPYYGVAAGDKFTTLLKEHIRVAIDLVDAAKTEDDARQKAAFSRWNTNAGDLAAFLHELNPNYWPVEELRSLIGEHLQLVSDVIGFRVHGHWTDDIAAHDKVHRQILILTDTFSAGITSQFPEKTAERRHD